MGVLGIDIGGSNIRVGYVDENVLVRVEENAIKKNGSKTEIINDLNSLINKFMNENIEGIGIGVPSVVDVEKGIAYDVQNIPAWKEVHLKKILEARFNVPVYLNNDANCFVIGEKYFGSVKKYGNIVGLAIGTGIGAGLIINNSLYLGKNCGAGEFGMVPYRDHDYEYYCSGQFFKNEFGTSGEELLQKADNADLKALDILSQFGYNLGDAIQTIMFTIDPDVIVLGGSVSKSFRYFKKEMWRSLRKFPYGKSLEKLEIKLSKTKYISVLGAAALFYDTMESDLTINNGTAISSERKLSNL